MKKDRPSTFNDLCKEVESVAVSMGLFASNEVAVPAGFAHVGWYCGDCGQRLPYRNVDGHRAGTKNGYLQTDCSTPAEGLVPMFIQDHEEN